jgi:hypothetical protein
MQEACKARGVLWISAGSPYQLLLYGFMGL